MGKLLQLGRLPKRDDEALGRQRARIALQLLELSQAELAELEVFLAGRQERADRVG